MDKNIAIITRHAVPNYGSFLQTYATQEVLRQMGFDTTVINYNRNDETAKVLARNYSLLNGNTLKSRIYFNTVWILSHLIACRQFKQARNKYLNETSILTASTISIIAGKYSIYLTGSDQVWNKVGSGETETIDENYFWSFVPDSEKIVSYAASFGEKGLSTEDKEKCKALLRKFKHISVREDSGCNIINEMGFAVQQVLDPVFLVGRTFWDKIADTCQKKRKQKFILVYNLHSNSKIENAVQNFLEEKNVQVVSLSTTFRHTFGKKIFCPSVEEFLWQFKNADYIIADSFHATAFAIIFNKPFTVVLPQQFSTRIESVLTLFDLQDRAYIIGEKSFHFDNDIDWNKINQKVVLERKLSLNWLENALK